MTLRNFAVAAVAVMTMTTTAALADNKEQASPIMIPAPPPGKGQIVFFRPGGMGFAVGCSVNEKGQKVSSLGAGKYFVMVAEPGRHDFSVKSEATDALGLEVEPDETQYASCKIKMGIMVGRPDIRPATEAEFRASKNLKMVDIDDMGPGEGALSPDQVAAALAAPTLVPAPASLPDSASVEQAASTPVASQE